ncbi:hypothetical protein EC968_007741 [Mortierella alpina]|nr:hypothetical protein EC968_007741 [Mortierella alpina]
MRSFSIVVAADLANGIGLRGGLPWRLRKDMAFFARITSKVVEQHSSPHDASSSSSSPINACIMGRLTWESIPPKFRPLSSRFNIIVSRNPHYLDDKPEKDNPLVALAPSLDAALDLVASMQKPTTTTTTATAPAPAAAASTGATGSSNSPTFQIERVFLIGGAQLYNEGIQSRNCQHIFLTRIQSTVECDTFFPEIRPQEYRLLPSPESHAFLEAYLQEPVEGGLIREGEFEYEYTVYDRVV